MVFHLEPIHPSRNCSLASYFLLKVLAFETLNPSEFPVTIRGEGMDIFGNHTMHEIRDPAKAQVGPIKQVQQAKSVLSRISLYDMSFLLG